MINVLFSRLLGAAKSGELYYTINNLSIITLLFSLSLESGMMYFLSKKKIDDKNLGTISFLWSFTAGGLAALLIFSIRNFFSAISYNIFGYSFLFITGTLLTTYFSSLFFGRRQFWLPHLIPAIINIIVAIVLGWIIVFKEQPNSFLAVDLFFSSFIATGIVLGILYYFRYGIAFSFHIPAKHTTIKLLQYSVVAFVTNIVAFLAYRIDYWILKSFQPRTISAEALGNYIQVAKLVQLFLFAPTIVATVIFPAIASGTDLTLNTNFRKLIWRVLLSNLVFCGAMLIIGKWLFTFVYGDSFSMMYMCFVFSVPAILSITVIRILASYFAANNKVRYNLGGGLIALAVIILLNFLLIPLMGINGAALADSSGYIAYMIFLLALFRHQNNNKL